MEDCDSNESENSSSELTSESPVDEVSDEVKQLITNKLETLNEYQRKLFDYLEPWIYNHLEYRVGDPENPLYWFNADTWYNIVFLLAQKLCNEPKDIKKDCWLTSSTLDQHGYPRFKITPAAPGVVKGNKIAWEKSRRKVSVHDFKITTVLVYPKLLGVFQVFILVT